MIEPCRDTRLRERLDVVPFLCRGAVGSRFPFRFECVVEGAVGEEIEEFGELGVGFPGILGGENVGSEVLTEEIETTTA